MRLLAVIATVLLTVSVWGQTFNTNMETSPFTTCIYPACNPGGLGTPTKTINKTSTAPGFVGNLEIGVSGSPYSNLLTWQKVGATDANYFHVEADAYIPKQTLNHAQALEYDVFAYNSPYRYMFGSECVLGAYWQIWDELHGNWVNTTLKCALTVGWHHIEWTFHRIPNDANCDGFPCEYYDELGVDYVYTHFNITEPAGPIPQGWNNNSGLNLQLDMNSSGVSLLEYFRHINLIELP